MIRDPTQRETLVEVEGHETVTKALDKVLGKKTAALAILSPYYPMQVTPRQSVQAILELREEVAVEEATEVIRGQGFDSLLLVINSYGGTASSSYKIASLLRKSFKDITVVVPHFAESGGTVLALSGNRVILGPMSNIGPIDLQVAREGEYWSVNAMIRAFGALTELFKETHVDDAPYPWVAMADKLDPVEFQAWMDASAEMDYYAGVILKDKRSPLRDRADAIIHALTLHLPTHTTAILREQAKEILGDYVVLSESEPDEWVAARAWLKAYAGSPSTSHFVRYYFPKRNTGTKAIRKRQLKAKAP
jgi:hypothetical protein